MGARWGETLSRGLDAVVTRTGSRSAGVAIWLAGTLLILLVIVSTVGVLLVGGDGGRATVLDRAVLDHLVGRRTPTLSVIWNTITVAGDTSLLVPLALTGGILWRLRRGDWFLLHLLGGAYLGAVVLFQAAKRIVGRARPDGDVAYNREVGLAFPSGHTTDAAAVYTAVALVVLLFVTVWALRVAVISVSAAVVVLVATSRLYLAAHWVTDVLAGVLLGSAWAGMLWLTLTARVGPYRRYGPHITTDRA
jgi:membrane-associated phospholipid phosphatase